MGFHPSEKNSRQNSDFGRVLLANSCNFAAICFRGDEMAKTAKKPKLESHEFQAEVAKLLQLMVHSVYSDRDVFLRELISNGADALDKLRYEAIGQPTLLGDAPLLNIVITPDKV